MPVYEYQCKQCGREFEYQQRMSDPDKTTCENCGGTLERLISRTAFTLKGGGWYKDLYSSSKPEKSGDAASGDAAAKSETATKSDTAKTDSSSAAPASTGTSSSTSTGSSSGSSSGSGSGGGSTGSGSGGGKTSGGSTP